MGTDREVAGWRVEVASSVDAIDRSGWDSLTAGRSVYSSWCWQRALEETHPWEPRYLLAKTGSGALGAALPAFVARGPANPLYDPEAFDVPRVGAAWYPGVVAGGRAGYLSELAAVPSARRRELLHLLFEGVDEIAAGCGAEASWLLYAAASDALDVAEALGPRSLVLLLGGDAAIDLVWPDFDGYLRYLSSDRRRAVRREIAAFARSGASTSVEGLDGLEAELAPLLVAVDHKHGHPTTLPEAERYFRAQAASLGEVSRVFACRRGGRLVGFALFYEWSRRLWARAVGFDYVHSESGDYFNTLFYDPIRWAIAAGLESVHFGVDGFETKLSRGCDFRPLWGVVAGRRPAADAAVTQTRQRNTTVAADLAGRYGRFMRRGFPREDIDAMRDAGWMSRS